MQLKTVGKIKSAHGLKGEIYILIFSRQTPWLASLKEFFVGAEQKFSLEKVKPHKDGVIVKSDQIKDRTQAEAMVGLPFQVDASFFVSGPGETIFLSEILGFQVYTDRVVGEIQGFSSNGPQDLLVVVDQNQSFEIPFVNDFIQNIDFQNKRIEMHLPDGLLEINMRE